MKMMEDEETLDEPNFTDRVFKSKGLFYHHHKTQQSLNHYLTSVNKNIFYLSFLQ